MRRVLVLMAILGLHVFASSSGHAACYSFQPNLSVPSIEVGRFRIQHPGGLLTTSASAEIPLGEAISAKVTNVEQTVTFYGTSHQADKVHVTINYTNGKAPFSNTFPLAAAFGTVGFNQPTDKAEVMLIKADSNDVWLGKLCEGP